MIFYEIAAFDPNDIVFNPMWHQGCASELALCWYFPWPV
jgi:hypothetical protein